MAAPLLLHRHGMMFPPVIPGDVQVLATVDLSGSHTLGDLTWSFVDQWDELELHLININGSSQLKWEFSTNNFSTLINSSQFSVDDLVDRNVSGQNGIITSGGAPSNSNSYIRYLGSRNVSGNTSFMGWASGYDFWQAGYFYSSNLTTHIRLQGGQNTTSGKLVIVGKLYSDRMSATKTGNNTENNHEFDVTGFDDIWFIHDALDAVGTTNLASRVGTSLGSPDTSADYDRGHATQNWDAAAFNSDHLLMSDTINAAWGQAFVHSLGLNARTGQFNTAYTSNNANVYVMTGSTPAGVHPAWRAITLDNSNWLSGSSITNAVKYFKKDVETQTFSAQNSKTFNVDGYDHIGIILNDFTKSVSGELLLEVSFDGGVTFNNTGQWQLQGWGAPGTFAVTADVAGLAINTAAQCVAVGYMTGLRGGLYPTLQLLSAHAGETECRWNRLLDTAKVTHIRIKGNNSANVTGECQVTKFKLSVPPSSPIGARRYWRVFIHETQGAGSPGAASVDEIEFRATPSGADQTGSGTAITDSITTGFPASNAFNDVTNSFWVADNINYGTHWIGYDFGAGNEVEVTEISFAKRPDSFGQAEAVTQGSVQWSDDGVFWNTAWAFTTPADWPTGAETRVFTKP